MRRLLFATFCLLSSVNAFAAAKALVIGIKDYSYWSRLQNSRNDAEDMAATLKNIGFDTTLITRDGQGEVDIQRFKQSIQDFAQQLQANDRVIFFYSGHGAAIPNDNGSSDGYLIASDTPAVTRNNKLQIQNNAVALKQIADTLSTRIDPDTGSLLFMIDACRNEVVNKGADVVEESSPSQPLSKQVEVIYATSNGSVSLDKLPTDENTHNGVFTRVAIAELQRHQNEAGYSSDQLFPAIKSKALQLARSAGKTQVPAWMNDTGKESFIFIPCPANQTCNITINTNSTTTSTTTDADQSFWNEIKNSTDASDYSAYLKQYPQGKFAALAESRRDKYQTKTSSHAVLDSLRLPDTTTDLPKERETNPQGTSIYESLSLKKDSKSTTLDDLRLPTGCSNLVLDLSKGTLNGIKPTASQTIVKQNFPCFTGDTEDGADYNYGGGVFFLNHDFYMYTGKDFIEVRSHFKGQIKPAVLGWSQADIMNRYGQPNISKSSRLFYNVNYGCLRFEFDRNGVSEVGVYNTSCQQASEI